jgi:hypothetical protein
MTSTQQKKSETRLPSSLFLRPHEI